MRIGRSRSRWWVSMSPLQWLLLGWVWLPFWVAGLALAGAAWLCWQVLRYAVLAAVAVAMITREKISERSNRRPAA